MDLYFEPNYAIPNARPPHKAVLRAPPQKPQRDTECARLHTHQSSRARREAGLADERARVAQAVRERARHTSHSGTGCTDNREPLWANTGRAWVLPAAQPVTLTQPSRHPCQGAHSVAASKDCEGKVLDSASSHQPATPTATHTT